jgi:hypothetical protein
MIYTVGYQNITIEQLEKIVEDKNIGLLTDVRSIPYSRIPEKYEFNKNRLAARFSDKYTWMGDRCGGKKGKAKPECIKKLIYLTTPPGERNLLLLCMEQHPCDCHRYYDIAKRLLNHGIEVRHLMMHEIDGYRVGLSEYTTSELNEVEKCRRK